MANMLQPEVVLGILCNVGPYLQVMECGAGLVNACFNIVIRYFKNPAVTAHCLHP